MPLRMEGPVGARTMINGRPYDYFAGTGYLGLQTHPAVIQAAVDALQRYGLSTATSRGGYGEHPIYHEFEKQANAYFGSEAVLYFPSGYQGTAILTQATGGQFEHIFIDSAAHFSLWDAASAANRPITPFHHCQPDHLRDCLRQEIHPGERPLVLSDGVFPISGEIAPLPDYLALIEPYQGRIYLDDAHALGVLGAHGRGTPEYYGIANEGCHTSGTLAKALGSSGGVIFGRADWIESIDRAAHILIGSSPPPLTITAASAQALSIARTHPELREQLWANVTQARNGLRNLDWALPDTPVPILCLTARDDINLPRIKSGLFKQGIATELIRSYPSTPAGGALRIAIFATHTPEQIDRLLQAIHSLV